MGNSTPGAADPHLPGPGEPWTPIRLTRWSGDYLLERGVEAGRLDAELLLAHVLQLKRLDLYLQHDRPLLPNELDAFKSLLKRRVAREPLQHIVGTAAFRALDLVVDERALIPRPETEVLVEEVLQWTKDRGGEGLAVLDVGTGTGAIAISLAREGPFARVLASDSSSKALELARLNARRAGVEERMEFRQGDLYEPLGQGDRFDVVVSNPPYIPAGEKDALEPEVRDWDPPEALFAGVEGLDVLLPLVENAPSHLSPQGLLALEVGDGQARRVARAMEQTHAFREIRIRPDLAGRERVVLGVA